MAMYSRYMYLCMYVCMHALAFRTFCFYKFYLSVRLKEDYIKNVNPGRENNHKDCCDYLIHTVDMKNEKKHFFIFRIQE
jgi:hypothetical protein